jgi:hypothetical protein
MISRLPQGFGTRCLRFAGGVALARARLASGWLVGLCRERVELSGSRRKVSERSHVVLLSRAYPDARQFMRDNWLSNRVFTDYNDIVTHCCDAWNKLVDQPWKIISIGMRDWAHRF